MNARPPIEMDASEIHEQGSYLHVESRLLLRVSEDDLAVARRMLANVHSGRVVQLSGNPRTPIAILRETAARYDYEVGF